MIFCEDFSVEMEDSVSFTNLPLDWLLVLILIKIIQENKVDLEKNILV